MPGSRGRCRGTASPSCPARRLPRPEPPCPATPRYVEAAVHSVLIGCLYLPNGNPWPGPKFDYKIDWIRLRLPQTAGLHGSERSWPGTTAWRRPTATSTPRGPGSRTHLCGPNRAHCKPSWLRRDGQTPLVRRSPPGAALMLVPYHLPDQYWRGALGELAAITVLPARAGRRGRQSRCRPDHSHLARIRRAA